ncbi:non-ribosomal peptide synthetase [Streptomyces sp. ML-6]|uniref:non-ribosomal peptide synthetase n=1 Tax=Streptomyces sp. ML-6 TaxID=2982693 RepID=UPI0024C06DEF|nr:non-ribosomal peptide synthetase [Streptomyces sp. ML-6]MDK0524710.1 non-ribosomal peptide synthetase [Streptomyces sp. ML-6]
MNSVADSVAGSAWLAPAWANDPELGPGRLRPAPEPEFPPDHTLHSRFAERAARTPDAVAVIARDRRLSYADVDAESARVASLLAGHGTTTGTLVGVVMHKGWEQVVGSLGVLRAGGAYVPMDPHWPARRLADVIAAAGLDTILTQPAVRDAVDWPEGLTVLDVEAPTPFGRNAARTAPDRPVTPRDVAYVIYTSGSTGVPKGVVIEHGPAVNTILDVNDELSLTAHDRVLGLSALHFDLSVYDIFGPLSVGGAVVLPGPQDAREPGNWLSLMAEEGVTVWNGVPALMAMVCEYLTSSQYPDPRPPDAPSALRAVLMSGDWIPVALPGEIRRFFPRAQQWSLGGATEASIWSIRHRIVPEDMALPSIPYGTSMRNQKVFVADTLLRPRPTWVVGEICIAGTGLAREYLGDEEKTAKSFTVSPHTGERVYRTGDWGRLLPNGEIEFLGRDDMQVKIGGHRVELGDVEAALLRCPEVAGAVVTAPGDRRRRRLVAHVVLEAGAGRTGADIKKAAGELLPPYMVPALVTVWDALPLTANGKVDRASLARHEEEPDTEDENARPATAEERTLLSLWKGFFETSSLSVLDNFFELGGDSLQAVRLMAKVREELDVSLPVSALFSAPTVRSLAARVQESRAAA